MSQLLREAIRLFLEKTRGTSFSLQKLEMMPNIEQRRAYIEKAGLKKLACGSSRCAYIFSSRWVLKLAENEKGLAQNESEVDFFTDPKTKPIVASIREYGKDFSWLVSELVRPITQESEFHRLTGIHFRYLQDILHQVDRFGEFGDWVRKEYTGKTIEFIENAVAAVTTGDRIAGDMEVVEHWGKTSTGRVVLLDYGLSRDVWDNHYDPDHGRRSPEPGGWEDDQEPPPDLGDDFDLPMMSPVTYRTKTTKQGYKK